MKSNKTTVSAAPGVIEIEDRSGNSATFTYSATDSGLVVRKSIKLSMVKVKVNPILCTCGHFFPPKPEAPTSISIVDYQCVKCDPEGFHLRMLFELHKRGWKINEALEEVCRNMQNAYDPIQLDGGK